MSLRGLTGGFVLAVALACGVDRGAGPDEPGQPDAQVAVERGICAGNAAVTGSLAYDGVVDLKCRARGLGKPGDVDEERIEISAPIWPDTEVMYRGEGENYPTLAEDQVKLAHQSSVTFARLLEECPPLYPTITLRHDGDRPLTPGQLATNYAAIEDCAYARYAAKPYWIPQLVEDVDICAAELGGDWRRISGDDLVTLGVDARQAIVETLDFGGATGGMYFSLRVYAVGAAGAIAQGDLSPPAAGSALVPISGHPLAHLEEALALRCVRRTTPVSSTVPRSVARVTRLRGLGPPPPRHGRCNEP